MITIDNIAYSYKKNQMLFSDFSLTIEKGKICGLLGKNGAGKSTLLYLISGLLFPKSGHITFNKEDVGKRLPSTLREIFLVPEEFELPPVSLSQYVAINRGFYPKFDSDKLSEYLQCFGMTADIHLKSLSLGQKKKVFLSFALATNTSLLIMDEPTNGLDIAGKSQFRKFLALGMTDNKTMIISTHQVQDVENMLDHIIIIDDNRLLLNKSTADITSQVSFVESSAGIHTDNIIFASPNIKGNAVLIKNTKGNETPINLELLYTALTTDEAAGGKMFDQ